MKGKEKRVRRPTFKFDTHLSAILVHFALNVNRNCTSTLIQNGKLRIVIEQTSHCNSLPTKKQKLTRLKPFSLLELTFLLLTRHQSSPQLHPSHFHEPSGKTTEQAPGRFPNRRQYDFYAPFLHEYVDK